MLHLLFKIESVAFVISDLRFYTTFKRQTEMYAYNDMIEEIVIPLKQSSIHPSGTYPQDDIIPLLFVSKYTLASFLFISHSVRAFS